MGFRENILKLLENKNLSQSDLAHRMGKSRQNISMLLKEGRKPSMTTVQEFAKALDVESSDLLEERDGERFIRSGEDSTTSYQRLFEYFHYKGFHPDEISKLARIPYLTLYSNALKGMEMDAETSQQLVYFEDLNISWIITGAGNMLSDPAKPTWEQEYSLPNAQQTWSRVLEYLLHSKISVEEFCIKAEIPLDYFLKGIRGEIDMPISGAIAISKVIPDVSLAWLTNGTGNMLVNKSHANETIEIEEEFTMLMSKEGTDFRSIRKSSSILISCPLISLEARTLYLQNREDENFATEELKNYVFSLPSLRLGTYRVFEDRISDPSQEESNSLNTRFVVGRKIEKITQRAAELLHKGPYVFVEEGKLSIEEMLNFNPQDNSFTCFSKSLGDVFSIELSKIKQLFIVEAVIDLRN